MAYVDHPRDYICDDCQQPVLVEFMVENAVWNRATDYMPFQHDPDYGPGYLCLRCFGSRCLDRGITEFYVRNLA